MKWWWVLVMVLLVPSASQAKEFTEPAVAIGIEGLAEEWPLKGEGWEYPKFTFLVVEPKENLHDVSVHIEFSTTGRSGENLDHLQAGRCEVYFLNTDQDTVQVFPTRKGDHLDLWMPYLNVGTELGVAVGWKATNKKEIWTASLSLQSREGMKNRRWENTVVRYENGPLRSKTIPKWLGTEEYPMQTVPLGAVCDQLNIGEIQVPPS